jgi:drug/metabolite transporter (DMT)-like permease
VAALASLCLLGLVGIGCYNALLYLALQTSSPINVTLVGSSMPVWMLVIGRLCFGARISLRQMLGAALSVLGVAVVLSRGDLRQLLSLQLVPGDLFVLLATILWSLYSWMLADTREPTSIRGDWAGFRWPSWSSAWAGRPCSPAANWRWAT